MIEELQERIYEREECKVDAHRLFEKKLRNNIVAPKLPSLLLVVDSASLTEAPSSVFASIIIL